MGCDTIEINLVYHINRKIIRYHKDQHKPQLKQVQLYSHLIYPGNFQQQLTL